MQSNRRRVDGIYQNLTLLKIYFTVCLNMSRGSSRCCIILSPMTESKIGHLRSRRDITLLDLIGSDWRGERGERRGSEIQ